MRQEPILLQAKRYTYFPLRFVHRGVERRVWRVERSWDVGAGWRQRPGHVFRVHCQDGTTCDLFHDVTLNAWFVRSAGMVWLNKVRSKTLGKGTLRWTFT